MTSSAGACQSGLLYLYKCQIYFVEDEPMVQIYNFVGVILLNRSGILLVNDAHQTHSKSENAL